MSRNSDPSKRTRLTVMERDLHSCVRCGARSHWCGLNIHHRHNRSHPYKNLNSPANLVTLCGSGDTGCHGWAHANIPEARQVGLVVSGFNDHPERVPLLTKHHGWVLLDDKGGYAPCEP